MRDSLSRAEHELDIANSGTDIGPWNRAFFTSGDFQGHRGAIANELALAVDDPRKAEHYTVVAAEAAQQSIAAAGGDRAPRSLLFDHITLATTSLRLAEPTSAPRQPGPR